MSQGRDERGLSLSQVLASFLIMTYLDFSLKIRPFNRFLL